MWGDRPSEGPLNSQKVLAELALRQMPPGSTSAERKCRIGGKPSTCSVLRGTASRSVFSILIGVVTLPIDRATGSPQSSQRCQEELMIRDHVGRMAH